MNHELFKIWEKERQKGRKRFVLLKGMCGIGLPSFVSLGFLTRDRPAWTFEDVGYVVFVCIICLFIGTVIGQIVWHSNEKSYHKEVKRRRERREQIRHS